MMRYSTNLPVRAALMAGLQRRDILRAAGSDTIGGRRAWVIGYRLPTGSDLRTASWGPVMWTITFTADNRRALAHDRYHHLDPHVQRKMEVLWLKSHGLSHHEIATCADVSRRTVQRYLDQDFEGGLPCLRRCRWHYAETALVEHESSLEEYRVVTKVEARRTRATLSSRQGS